MFWSFVNFLFYFFFLGGGLFCFLFWRCFLGGCFRILHCKGSNGTSSGFEIRSTLDDNHTVRMSKYTATVLQWR